MTAHGLPMEGSASFYTFAYLWQAAWSSFKSAKSNPLGSNYRRVSAVLFSAFTVEAHLNHVGEARLSFWSIVEPKLPWKAKLELVAQQLKIEVDYGSRPFQTLSEVFKFREKLAHGKTQTYDVTYELKSDPADDSSQTEPHWLKKYWSNEAVERVLQDTQQILEEFHERAGFRKDSLHLISDGAFQQRQDSSLGP